MSIPTASEEYAKLMEFLRKAQESAATLAHLRRAEGGAHSQIIANGWLAISELMRGVQHKVIEIAKGNLN